MIGPQSGHDRVTIGRRSWSSISVDRCLDRVEAILQRKFHDRGSIVPRSRFDLTAIVEFFHELCRPSDETLVGWTIAISRSRAPRSWCESTASCPIELQMRWMVTIVWSREPLLRGASDVRWEVTSVSMHHRRPCIWIKSTIPIDDGWTTLTIGRCWAFHVSSGKSLDHFHLRVF